MRLLPPSPATLGSIENQNHHHHHHHHHHHCNARGAPIRPASRRRSFATSNRWRLLAAGERLPRWRSSPRPLLLPPPHRHPLPPPQPRDYHSWAWRKSSSGSKCPSVAAAASNSTAARLQRGGTSSPTSTMGTGTAERNASRVRQKNECFRFQSILPHQVINKPLPVFARSPTDHLAHFPDSVRLRLCPTP